MLSSVSLGAGLKTRPTPNAAPPTPSSPQQDARHCVTPDPSAAVEALEASLEACLKSAAALGGTAPTGAAARLAAKADRLSKTVAALGDATRKSDFFFIHRDRFLNAFSNLPEVLAEMAAREDVYRRRPVRVPKASLGST